MKLTELGLRENSLYKLLQIGRIIIALFMMQSDSLSILIFFVSEELEKQREKYYHLLNKTRGNSPRLV